MSAPDREGAGLNRNWRAAGARARGVLGNGDGSDGVESPIDGEVAGDGDGADYSSSSSSIWASSPPLHPHHSPRSPTPYLSGPPAAPQDRDDELLSDLPALIRQHRTSGYLSGLSLGKSSASVAQTAFDAGYGEGATLGARVGWVLEMLRILQDASEGNGNGGDGAMMEEEGRGHGEAGDGDGDEGTGCDWGELVRRAQVELDAEVLLRECFGSEAAAVGGDELDAVGAGAVQGATDAAPASATAAAAAASMPRRAALPATLRWWSAEVERLGRIVGVDARYPG